jgi:hypothetical protein
MTNNPSRPRGSRAILRVRWTIALVALATLTATLALTAAASAQSRYQLRNWETDRCIYALSSGAVLPTAGCGPGSNTQWYMHQWPIDKTYQFRNRGNGMCLDDSFAFGLRTFPCHAGSNPASAFQSWHRVATQFGPAWQNQVTLRCLDDSFQYGLRPFVCHPPGSHWNRHQAFNTYFVYW